MRACWLKWVGRDWSISADYIWLNYSGANNTMDVNELIDFWDRSRDPADQWIVITDVYGGSVNNAFMERLGDDSLRLIAGMSLPLVLEVFSKLSTLDDAELAALVSSVRQKGTCLCSLPNSVEEDEDF